MMIRYVKRAPFFEWFFVTGIATILITRLFLMLTGYPQLGGSAGLHIAHVLWGGLLMMAALVMVLNFVSNAFVLHIVAVAGGAGFGLFIDEVGKFVTQDVNYFYRPSFSIMYVIFVLIYLTNYAIYSRSYTRSEYLINSIELMKEAVMKQMDADERQAALTYLTRCENINPVVPLLDNFYRSLDGLEPPARNLFHRQRERFNNWRNTLVSWRWFNVSVVVLFVGNALLLGIVTTIYIIYLKDFKISVSEQIPLAAAILEGVLTFYGLIRLFSRPMQTYLAFRYAVLVSILITRVFSFYEDPLTALALLFADILLLIILEGMIERQRQVHLQNSQPIPA